MNPFSLSARSVNRYRSQHLSLRISTILFLFYCCDIRAQTNTPFEPPDGFVYHGVGWGTQAQIEYGNMFTPMQQPLLFQNIFAIPGGTRPLTVDRIRGMLRPDHIDPDRQFAEISVHFMIDGQAVDSAFAFSDEYDPYIDTLAQALLIHDSPVFLRIGLEMNGAWNGYTPWIFTKAFRKLAEALHHREIDNVAYVWCYEPDAPADFADSTENGWAWYPGDDVVDWFGLDLFDADHFDPDLPDSTRNDLTKKGRSEAFLEFARERGKPVYLNELSARNVFITPDAADPDSTDGKHDWETWFEPFFRFLDLHPSVKAFNYIDLDWTQIPQYASWGNARIEINNTIRERWIERLAGSRFLHIGTDIKNPDTNISNHTDDETPQEFDLRLTAYPNPFNESTVIRYDLRRESDIRLDVFNLIGQHQTTLVQGMQAAGQHQYVWEPFRLSSGIYLIVLLSPDGRATQKVIIMK
jgi:hypothetical protein